MLESAGHSQVFGHVGPDSNMKRLCIILLPLSLSCRLVSLLMLKCMKNKKQWFPGLNCNILHV